MKEDFDDVLHAHNDVARIEAALLEPRTGSLHGFQDTIIGGFIGCPPRVARAGF